MLKHHTVPQLRREMVLRSAIFQHDGAPPHFSHKAMNFIKLTFTEDRVIGRGYGIIISGAHSNNPQ